MKLIFERSVEGRGLSLLPALDVPEVAPSKEHKREQKMKLPQVSEIEISRHYKQLQDQTFGINNGFYPLGSCTMKYNPKVNEDVANMPEFARIHPLQRSETVQGCLEVMDLAKKYLSEVTGMDDFSFQPAAGAHGEFTGLLLIRAYHEARGDHKRTQIIVPDTAHGTNPASAAMVGYDVINIPSNQDGGVDVKALKGALSDKTAGFMLTNPNTLGLFDKNVNEITKLVHDAGGLNYYDGANLNAIMGITRPGDMGFDVIHLNLHKTFSTPHGGGGPGAGPVGCKDFLSKFLPNPRISQENGLYKFDYDNEESIGRVKGFYGNFLVVVRALTYILTLGSDGLKEASQTAILNANYLMYHLGKVYDIPFKDHCMHEFVISAEQLKHDNNVSALDIAKTVLDYGIHPPTMYFPINIPEALMIEPVETESKEELDRAIEIFTEIHDKIMEDPESLHESPRTTPIGRPDEVKAARTPILRYTFD